MDNTLIRYKNVIKRYNDTCALDNFSLSVEKGSITYLMGLNGAGK